MKVIRSKVRYRIPRDTRGRFVAGPRWIVRRVLERTAGGAMIERRRVWAIAAKRDKRGRFAGWKELHMVLPGPTYAEWPRVVAA